MEEHKYIVSARKYRPSSFESVVGQKALTETLRNAIRSNHLAHAYLFCGPRGVGKTTCARIFAKAINCLSPTADHDACNQCESCTAFNEQRSYNVRELDAASNNSVDGIRNLIDEVRVPPQVGKYSVYIIDEVHMLSPSAFNALLKTLEEPPAHAIFILATTEKHKVLPTILSRCQVFDFARITIGDIVGHLQYVAREEGVTVSEEALNAVAQKADGGMRDALSIFDQLVTFCGNNITYEQTIAALNVLDTEYYFRLTDAALKGDISSALLLLDEVLSKGFDAGHFVSGLTSHLRNVLVSKDAATVCLLEVSEQVRKRYAEQASRCTAPWLLRVLEVMGQCDINYRTARNKRLTVELALVKMCSLMMPEMQQAQVAPAAPQRAPQAAQQAAPQVQPRAAAPASASAAAPQRAPQAVQQAVQQATVRPQAAAMAAPSAVAAPKVAAGIPRAVASPGVPKMPSAPAAPASGANANAAANAVAEGIQSQQNTEKPSRPFSQEQLAEAWESLRSLSTFKANQRLLAMLSNTAPLISTMPAITVFLQNSYQKQELLQYMPAVVNSLREKLQNSLITCELEIDETKIEKVAYTPKEKLDKMVERNANVADMVQALGFQFA